MRCTPHWHKPRALALAVAGAFLQAPAPALAEEPATLYVVGDNSQPITAQVSVGDFRLEVGPNPPVIPGAAVVRADNAAGLPTTITGQNVVVFIVSPPGSSGDVQLTGPISASGSLTMNTPGNLAIGQPLSVSGLQVLSAGGSITLSASVRPDVLAASEIGQVSVSSGSQVVVSGTASVTLSGPPSSSQPLGLHSTDTAVTQAYVGPADPAKLGAASRGLDRLLAAITPLTNAGLHFGYGFASLSMSQSQTSINFTDETISIDSVRVPPSTLEPALTELQASSDADLGPLGRALELDGNRLRALASFGSAREIGIGGGGGWIHTNGFDLSFSGRVTAQGTLTKEGAGTLWLSGDNVWNGHSVIVTGGTLKGDTGSLQTDIASSGTVEFAQGADGAYSKTLSGAGSLVKTGAGTLTLSGAQTYTGETRVQQGQLALQGEGRLAGAGDFKTLAVLEDGATLNLSAATRASTLAGLAGAGSVVLGSSGLMLEPRGDHRFTGVISGPGGLTVLGPGRQVLSGASTYAGATSISGGTLALRGAGALDPASALVLSGGRFHIGEADGTREAASLSGSAGEVVLGANRLVVGNDGTSTVFAGSVRGAGGLTKAGSGTLSLSGANTYSGTTEIGAGVLALQGAGSLNAASAVVLSAQGAFDIGSASGAREVASLSGPGGQVLLGGNTLALRATSGSATYSGAISGSGGLSKAGAATQVLAGSSTYTGDTQIFDGVLALSGSGKLDPGSRLLLSAGKLDISQADGSREVASLAGSGGEIVLGANTLIVGRDDRDTSFAGAISGSAGLTKRGTGTLSLSGSNTYSGLTKIEAGTVVARPYSIRADVANSGTLVFSQPQSDPIRAYSGRISGSGRVVKEGDAFLWLRGTNSYTGGTEVRGGVLIGNTDSLQGDVANNAGLAFYQVEPGSYSGHIAGTGTVFKYGAGALALEGANTYSGGTVFSGVLKVGRNDALGADRGALAMVGGVLQASSSFAMSREIGVAAGGGVVDTSGHDLVLSGRVAGAGALAKTGAGTLTLSGPLHNAGGIVVAGGRLVMEGGLARDVVVGPGAEFFGPGTIGRNLTAYGRVARGAGIGVLEVGGNVSFARGSTLLLRADAAGNSDRLRAAGNASLQGGLVDVRATAGDYALNTDYVILTAAGGVTGRFDAVTSNLAFLTPRLAYTADQVQLRLSRNDVVLASAAVSAQQQQVAQILGAMDGSDGDWRIITDALIRLSPQQARAAFDSIGAHSLPSVARVSALSQRGAGQAVRGRIGLVAGDSTLSAGLAPGSLQWGREQPVKLAALGVLPGGADEAPAPGMRHGVWLRGFGGGGRLNVDGGDDADYRLGGIVLGYDARLAGGHTLGAYAGYSEPRLDQGPDTTRVDASSAGLYGRLVSERFHLDGVLSLAASRFHTRREVVVGALERTAEARFDGRSESIELEAGYSFPGAVQIQPLAALHWARQRQDAYAEEGAGALSLAVDAGHSYSTRVGLGARLLDVDPQRSWKARAMWWRELREPRALQVRLVGDPASTRLPLSGGDPARNSLQLAAGYAVALFGGWRLQADADAELSSDQRSYTFGLAGRYRW